MIWRLLLATCRVIGERYLITGIDVWLGTIDSLDKGGEAVIQGLVILLARREPTECAQRAKSATPS